MAMIPDGQRGGCLWAAVLAAAVTLVSAGVKGFGIVFSVEPLQGSTAGGTELHIAGAGFAYVSEVLIGGKPCHIFEPSVKDGEMTVYSPALPELRAGYDVEVVYTSGHIATLRTDKFRTYDRVTPSVTYLPTRATQVIHNVTWEGSLLKQLELNMQEIFEDTGEKRNATEIMHAYLGSGLEVLSDKGGREEFRCDILETPTMFDGVCEVSAGTPAGYYNFTYVLQDAKTGEGYGRNSWEVRLGRWEDGSHLEWVGSLREEQPADCFLTDGHGGDFNDRTYSC